MDGEIRRSIKRLRVVGSKSGAWATLAVALSMSALASPASAQGYTWKNVQIVGGGFVPGIVFNQTEPNLVYARTDIGGAYRLEPRHRPLGAAARLGRLGQLGLHRRRQPRHRPGRPEPGLRRRRHVHQRLGPEQRRDPALRRPGRDLADHRRCRSSSAATCPAAAWASGWPSTRTATPSSTSAPPSGNGLWRSTDSGVTWAKVAGFPNRRQLRAGPERPHRLPDRHTRACIWVDVRQAHRHGRQRDPDHLRRRGRQGRTRVYRSTDGGATWARARRPAAPASWPHKGVAGPRSNGLPLHRRPATPAARTTAARARSGSYATATGAWTADQPGRRRPQRRGDYFGYSGLTIDRQNPSTIMVAAHSSWWPDTIIFRSTDGGATWTRIWDWSRPTPTAASATRMDITALALADLAAAPHRQPPARCRSSAG